MLIVMATQSLRWWLENPIVRLAPICVESVVRLAGLGTCKDAGYFWGRDACPPRIRRSR